jgi:hypothetical protein
LFRAAPVAALALMVTGCVAQTPPISNPNGLPAEALTLEYLVRDGCLPYALGLKSEDEAMRSVRLNRFKPLLGLEPGDTAPFWQGSYSGRPRVNVGRGVCNTIIHGADVDAYRTATEIALRRGFGGSADDGRADYKVRVPGQITGCRNGVHYTFYPTDGRGRFEVDLSRVADCIHDPLKETR